MKRGNFSLSQNSRTQAHSVYLTAGRFKRTDFAGQEEGLPQLFLHVIADPTGRSHKSWYLWVKLMDESPYGLTAHLVWALEGACEYLLQVSNRKGCLPPFPPLWASQRHLVRHSGGTCLIYALLKVNDRPASGWFSWLEEVFSSQMNAA